MSQIKNAIKDLISQVIDLVGGVRGAAVELRIQDTQVVLTCDLAEGAAPVKANTPMPAGVAPTSPAEYGEKIKEALAERPQSLKALAEQLGVAPKAAIKPAMKTLIRQGVVEKAGPAFRLVTGEPRRRGRPPKKEVKQVASSPVPVVPPRPVARPRPVKAQPKARRPVRKATPPVVAKKSVVKLTRQLSPKKKTTPRPSRARPATPARSSEPPSADPAAPPAETTSPEMDIQEDAPTGA